MSRKIQNLIRSMAGGLFHAAPPSPSSNEALVGSVGSLEDHHLRPQERVLVDETLDDHGGSRHLLGTWQTITYDDFENGNWGSFADGGSDAHVMSTRYAHGGSYCLRLRDNSGEQSSAFQHSNHDVTPYLELEVSFWFYAKGMENNEDFLLEYSADGGTTWNIVKAWAKGTDFENDIYYNEFVHISEPSFNLTTDKARIRFKCDASVNNDQVYLDQIHLQGIAEPTPLPTPNPTVSQAPSETPSSFPSDAPSFQPSFMPSTDPSSVPSLEPSLEPSLMPSTAPSVTPEPSSFLQPSSDPSSNPSDAPSTAPSKEPSKAPTGPTAPLTCPDGYCGSSLVTTMDPVGCSNAGLAAIQLDVFTHQNDDLIRLLGPSDPADAAAVVISVPHGGDLKPLYVSTRSSSHSSCPSSGCVTSKDSYTIDIAMLVIDHFIQNYCKVPYVVINYLHRSKLDANRDIAEAAQVRIGTVFFSFIILFSLCSPRLLLQGDAVAEDAWEHFHDFIADAQNRTIARMGTVLNNVNVEGARGLLFDLHGYTGTGWIPIGGGCPFIQWGYRIDDEMMNLNTAANCPIDNLNISDSDAVGAFTHACELPGQTYECLVRGPGSLGSRVNARLGAGTGDCGTGLPSYEFPDPYDTERDGSYCDDTPCKYYRGGFDVDVHEYLDWRTFSGTKFNAVQAELPRCIRFDENGGRDEIANVLSIEICSFLGDVFPDDIYAHSLC